MSLSTDVRTPERLQLQRSIPSSPTIQGQLQSGAMGGLLRALDTIKSVLREDVALDIDLTFPRIIVCGQETTGKSSVLERICQFPLFPRGQSITTRMPVELRMRRFSREEIEAEARSTGLMNYHEGCMILRIFATVNGKLEQQTHLVDGTTPESIERVIAACQAFVLEKLSTTFTTEPLSLEIWSNVVPDLELVDLPGVIGAQIRGEDASTPMLTKKIARQYLNDSNTIVISIVPATIDRVRNDTVMGMIQEAGKQNVTICALTKADLCNRSHYNSRDPYEDLKARARGLADDCPDIGGGYVALVNRDTRASTCASLPDSHQDELQWFRNNTPELLSEGCASISSLIRKIDCLMNTFTREQWAPRAESRLREPLRVLQKKIERLGQDPCLGNRKKASSFLGKVLHLCYSAIKKQFSSVSVKIDLSGILEEAQHLNSFSWEQRKYARYLHLVTKALSPPDFYDVFGANYCLDLICDIFKSTDLPLKLDRFSGLHTHIAMKLQGQVKKHIESAKNRWRKEFPILMVGQCVPQENRVFLKEINALALVIFEQEIVMELESELTPDYFQRLMFDCDPCEVLKEDCAQERSELKRSFEAIQQAMKLISELRKGGK